MTNLAKKCSSGQRFIFPKWLSKIHTLEGPGKQFHIISIFLYFNPKAQRKLPRKFPLVQKLKIIIKRLSNCSIQIKNCNFGSFSFLMNFVLLTTNGFVVCTLKWITLFELGCWLLFLDTSNYSLIDIFTHIKYLVITFVFKGFGFFWKTLPIDIVIVLIRTSNTALSTKGINGPFIF